MPPCSSRARSPWATPSSWTDRAPAPITDTAVQRVTPGARRRCTVREDHGMRILVVSDLHYRLPHYDWLVAAAPGADGDAAVGHLADVLSPVPPAAQTVPLTRYPARLAAHGPVLVASGNHDLDGPGAHGEQVASWLRLPQPESVHVDGMSVDIGDTRFAVCPWWDGPVTRDQVAAQLAAAA